MRPCAGRGKGRETIEFSSAQALSSISALSARLTASGIVTDEMGLTHKKAFLVVIVRNELLQFCGRDFGLGLEYRFLRGAFSHGYCGYCHSFIHMPCLLAFTKYRMVGRKNENQDRRARGGGRRFLGRSSGDSGGRHARRNNGRTAEQSARG